jgi:hypothetical protein
MHVNAHNSTVSANTVCTVMSVGSIKHEIIDSQNITNDTKADDFIFPYLSHKAVIMSTHIYMPVDWCRPVSESSQVNMPAVKNPLVATHSNSKTH